MRFFVVLVAACAAVALAEEAVLLPPAETLDVADGGRSTRAAKFEVSLSKYPAYGVPSGDFPTYFERAVMTVYNACRTGRLTYMNKYIKPYMYSSSDTTYKKVFTGSNLKAGLPIPVNPNFVRGARAHCADRLKCKSSSSSGHNDCNGSSFGTRIKRWYEPKSTVGEIYFSMGTGTHHMTNPFTIIGGYVCDGPTYTTLGKFASCPADSKAGHRQNIMKHGGEFGCGYRVDSADATITSCNSAAKGKYSTVPKLVTGAHLVDPADRSKFFFMASFRGACSTAATVVVDGARISMSRESCSGSNGGTYITASQPLPAGGCQKYYFEVGGERLPRSGYFNTYGLGSCQVDYSA